MSIYIGIMSGTSLDGIDLVAADFDQDKITVLKQTMYPFPDNLKNKLIHLSQGHQTSLAEIGHIDHFLGQSYADAVNQFLCLCKLNANEITAIGCHGQTVFHQPTGDMPFTMQLGDPNIIAIKTAITTVADFRRKDMALGGQGAPLVPAFHQAIFANEQQQTVVLNIGGISNISVLIPNRPVIGYDTGPGNMLMDSWIKKHLNKPFDNNGQWAAFGKTIPSLLKQFLKDPYFKLAPPKSTGREYFHQQWLEKQISSSEQLLRAQDVQATLLALTAHSIVDEIKQYGFGQLLVCGGGAKNAALMTLLQDLLPTWQVMTTDKKNVSADAMEALAFAWLAKQAIEAKPSNLPEVTGASRQCRLGAIYYAD